MTITRRSALAGGALALAAASRPSHAAGEQVIVGTWGGDYGSLLQSAIDQPLMKPLGTCTQFL